MKLILTLKDPDGVEDSLRDAVENGADLEDLRTQISKFVEYSEYVRVEIDTDAGTARVLEVK